MSNKPTIVIRLYRCVGNVLEDTTEQFNLSQLAGTVPAVGDLIVDPGCLEGKDRENPVNRTIYEVISRYFLPGKHDEDSEDSSVAIVVKERTASTTEASITCIA